MAEKLEKIQKLGEKGKANKLFGFLTSKKTDERTAAVKALGGIKSEDSFNKLIIMLEDPEFEVRKQAVAALGEQANPKAMEFLRHAMKRENNDEFSDVARKAMSQVTPDN